MAMNELELLRAIYSLHLATVLLFTGVVTMFFLVVFLKWILPHYWYRKRSTVA